jgi:hypothetical protein
VRSIFETPRTSTHNASVGGGANTIQLSTLRETWNKPADWRLTRSQKVAKNVKAARMTTQPIESRGSRGGALGVMNSGFGPFESDMVSLRL